MKKSVSIIIVILTVAMLVATSGCTSNKSNLSARDYDDVGWLLANQGKYKEAIDDYTKAIELDSQDAHFYSDRGSAYLDMKEFDLAIADFDQAIKLDPNLVYAYYSRGYAYWFKGAPFFNLAIMDFNKVVELSKNADLTAGAKNSLEILNQNLPQMAVIPPPPVIETPIAPIINNGNQQGNVKPQSDTENVSPWRGGWKGTIEVVEWYSYDDGMEGGQGELNAKGDFTFNIDKNDYISGTGTVQGSASSKIVDHTADDRISTSLGNFKAVFKVSEGQFMGPLRPAPVPQLPGVQSTTVPWVPQSLRFGDFQPSKYERAVTGSGIFPGQEDILAEIGPVGPPALTYEYFMEFPVKFEDGAGYEEEWNRPISGDSPNVYHITIKIYRVSQSGDSSR